MTRFGGPNNSSTNNMLSSSFCPGKKVTDFRFLKFKMSRPCSYGKFLRPKQERRRFYVVSRFFPRVQKYKICAYDLPCATRMKKAVFTCLLESETKKTAEQGATWRRRLAVLLLKMVIRSCDVGVVGSACPTSDLPKAHGRYSMSASARSTPI